MVIVSILPQEEFGPNDHRVDAAHFNMNINNLDTYNMDYKISMRISRMSALF